MFRFVMKSQDVVNWFINEKHIRTLENYEPLQNLSNLFDGKGGTRNLEQFLSTFINWMIKRLANNEYNTILKPKEKLTFKKGRRLRGSQDC
mmetsp:Transcript_34351/g.38935  ORF Transcript_34351/g.38935 Transcript_34351/m.38935 type:complete len:91 (-) Transcript_34351:643-915(-)